MISFVGGTYRESLNLPSGCNNRKELPWSDPFSRSHPQARPFSPFSDFSTISPYHVKMPAPSQLSIATSAVLRLLKEEISYHKELVDQEAQVTVLEEKIKSGQTSEDGNEEFMLKQQVCPLFPGTQARLWTMMLTVREASGCRADQGRLRAP